jgi:hypothetical protein
VTAPNQIADILAKHGEPLAGNIWRVQGQPVIYHKALERIAERANIAFDPPTIVRAEAEEAVILVTGRMGERMAWSIGEAKLGVNYRVSGRQAAYLWAMAEKRAKDRVILKLIGLHGEVYAEDEADEFRGEIKRQAAQQRLSQRQNRAPSAPPPPPKRTVYDPETGGQVEAKPVSQVFDPSPGEPGYRPPLPAHDPETGEIDDFPGNDAIREKEAEETARKVKAADELRNRAYEAAPSIASAIDKARTINAVTDLMLRPDIKGTLDGLGQDRRDTLRDYGKARLMALGWPSKRRA